MVSIRGMQRERVEELAHRALRGAGIRNSPRLDVVQSVEDLPSHLRDRLVRANTTQTTKAIFEPGVDHDRIHVIAANLAHPTEVIETIYHETVGHYGLRVLMSAATYTEVMDGLWRDLPDRVRAAAKRNGLSVDVISQRRAAAEEVIAYAAGQHLAGIPLSGSLTSWWQRAWDAIRRFVTEVFGRHQFDDRRILEIVQRAHDTLRRPPDTTSTLEADLSETHRAAVFYSAVEQVIAASRQNRATPTQWLAMIKSAAGVKAEEIDWLELEPWLKAHAGQVMRSELVEYIRAHQLEIRETLFENLGLGGDHTDAERLQLQLKEVLRALRYDTHFEFGGKLLMIGVPVGEPMGIEQDYQWKHLRDAEDMASLPASIREYALELERVSDRVAIERQARAPVPEHSAVPEWRAPQYIKYTLPGGNNYRELLLRMPHTGNRLRSDFESKHWDETNVVASVRFNSRVDADGKQVLFLEEIQSDWHQNGRKSGYLSDTDDIRREAARQACDEVTPKARAILNRYYAPEDMIDLGFHIRCSDSWRSRVTESLDREVIEQYKQRWAELDEAKHPFRAGQVPNAPLKASWPALVMKRMIRWGVERGFDRIAWTTGQQQIDRYALEQKFDRLEYDPKKLQLRGYKGDRLELECGRDPEELQEILGREVAARLIEQPIKRLGDSDRVHVLAGPDLRVGGSGMRGFYDEILPRETSKLIAKWGGKVVLAPLKLCSAGLGEVYLGPPVSYEELIRVAAQSAIEYRVARKVQHIASQIRRGVPFSKVMAEEGTHRTAELLGGRMISIAQIQQVHAFDITAELHSAALGRGFPLFSQGVAEPASWHPEMPGCRPLPGLAPAYPTSSALTETTVVKFEPEGDTYSPGR
jgi:hypothetical protein